MSLGNFIFNDDFQKKKKKNVREKDQLGECKNC